MLEGIKTFVDSATTGDLQDVQKLSEAELTRRRETFYVDGACTGRSICPHPPTPSGIFQIPERPGPGERAQPGTLLEPRSPEASLLPGGMAAPFESSAVTGIAELPSDTDRLHAKSLR